MTCLAPVILLVAALILGIPIALSLVGASIIGIWMITDSIQVVMGMLGTTIFNSVAQYLLTTVPMFILMAYFSSSSGLADDLFNAGAKWLSHIRGGLAIATVFSCMVFGAMSGASVAAASVMSNIAMPQMRRFRYSEELAAGSIGVGAVLDILIPPSVAMVIYGIATETSVGKLLIAGVIPAIILFIFLAIAIVVWVTISPSHAPVTERASWPERWRSLRPIWPSLILIFIVLGLLYTGVATPSEVGAIGALTSAAIGIVTRRLTLAGAVDALKKTIRVTTMIFLIIIGASMFGYFMTLTRIPQEIMALFAEMNLNRWIIICGIVVGYFVISMFMDEVPVLLITLPLTFPLVTAQGFDPIWFGVLSMMMVAMGLVFPPVGMCAFVVSAAAQVDLVKVYRGTVVLMSAIVATAVLITIFPEIVLWLPSRVY